MIASNAVNSQFYFGDTAEAQRYIEANHKVAVNGVAVIRYYIFDSRYSQPADIKKYFASVQDLRRRTYAIYSAVVDVARCDRMKDTPRDLLLLDGGILAETKLGSRLTVDYAQATVDATELKAARNYLTETLDYCAQAQNRVDEMSDEEMQAYARALYDKNVAKYPRRPGAAESLAHLIYEGAIQNERNNQAGLPN